MQVSIRQKSLILTLLIHAAIILILLLVILTTPTPPLGGGEGVLVNIGYMDMASGEEQPMSENTTEDPAVKQTPQPVNTDVDVATQDLEDAPEIVKKTPKKVELKPTPVIKTETPPIKKPEPKPVPERTADPRALYKGKSNNSTSQGTAATGTGDQGDPLGNPFSNQYGKPGNGNGNGTGNGTGNGSGNGNGPGVSYDLAGRSWSQKPTVKDDSQEQGRVVIDVIVDKNGTVVSASGPGRNSTTTSAVLLKKAKEAALKARFSPSSNGVEEQRGTITFNFVLR